MTVDEVKILLSDLNRGYNTPYSSAEQATIERLYYEVLGKHLNGSKKNIWRGRTRMGKRSMFV